MGLLALLVLAALCSSQYVSRDLRRYPRDWRDFFANADPWLAPRAHDERRVVRSFYSYDGVRAEDIFCLNDARLCTLRRFNWVGLRCVGCTGSCNPPQNWAEDVIANFQEDWEARKDDIDCIAYRASLLK